MTSMIDGTSTDVASGPAFPLAQSACPPWCEIDDHNAWDGGLMHHVSATTVGLAYYPYEFTRTEEGTPVTGREYDYVIVCRLQVLDGEEAISIEVPPIAGCTAPDGLRDTGRGASLTLDEAQRTGVSLLVMAGRAHGGRHSTSAPGDPSPCCPGLALGASAYPSAVFCPGCGSLYWRAQAPR